MEYHKKMMNVITDLYTGFKYAVIITNKTSKWFKIKARVKPKQGCVSPLFVFTGHYLGDEEDNRRQEKRHKTKFQIGAGGPYFADDITCCFFKLNPFINPENQIVPTLKLTDYNAFLYLSENC